MINSRALFGALRRPSGAQQLRQPLGHRAFALALEMLAGPLEGGLKALPAEWLQQVVEGLHVKGANRVLVIGGDEHGRRHPIDADGLDHLEAVHARHLQIEKHQVRRRLANVIDGFFAGRRGAGQFDARFRGEQRHQALAGHRLIVGHQDANHHATSSLFAAACPP